MCAFPRPLERIRVVQFEDKRPEQVYARAGPEARHRDTIRRVSIKPNDRRLFGRPRESGICKERELGGQVRKVDQSELLRAEKRQPHLGTHQRGAGTVETIHLRASIHSGTLARLEAREAVTAYKGRVIPVSEVLRGEDVILLSAVVADVERPPRECDGIQEVIPAIVGAHGHVAGAADHGRGLYTEAAAAARRRKAEERVIAYVGERRLEEVDGIGRRDLLDLPLPTAESTYVPFELVVESVANHAAGEVKTARRRERIRCEETDFADENASVLADDDRKSLRRIRLIGVARQQGNVTCRDAPVEPPLAVDVRDLGADILQGALRLGNHAERTVAEHVAEVKADATAELRAEGPAD